VLWRIQTLANRPDNTWRSAGDVPVVQQYFNWGLWSLDEGMREVIANPILDIGAMERAARDLIDALKPRLEQLPFSLNDRYELWACDHAGNPIVLVESATSQQDTQGVGDKTWKAVAKNDHGFVSASLETAGECGGYDHKQRRHADYLESQAHARTDANRWFWRDPDDRGVAIDGETMLAPEAFPALGISERWDDSLTQEAFTDFLKWNAPLLLTLTMRDEKREYLERQASQRPVLVDDLHRLYPAIINPKLIERLRIQARLLRSQ